jgi:uncharacterized protein (TIGR02284 family)
MGTQTDLNLDPETVAKLQELIRANIDSYDGFHEASEEIEDKAISRLFRDIANDRSLMASELQQYVDWNGEEAAKEGSLAGSIYQAWVSIRNKISGGDAYTILSEAERGEDRIKDAYEDVLKSTSESAIHNVLMSQYSNIKAGHDRVRDLRDAYKPRT